MRHFTDMRAARFQVGEFRLLLGCQLLGTGKLGGLRGFFPGSQLVCSLLLLALDAVFAIFVAFARLIRELLVVFARANLALGKTVILYQRDVAGADIAARAAFDAVEQAEFLRPAELFGLGEPEQILRLQIRRAHIGAASATD